MEIKDAVARVTVVPENRTDVKVEFLTRNASLPFEMRTNGDKLIVDGNLKRRIRNCSSGHNGGRPHVRIRDVGEISYEKMPQIVIRTPLNADVDTGGAIWGSVGRSDSLKLGNAGCGDWKIANVEGRMRASARPVQAGILRAGSRG